MLALWITDLLGPGSLTKEHTFLLIFYWFLLIKLFCLRNLLERIYVYTFESEVFSNRFKDNVELIRPFIISFGTSALQLFFYHFFEGNVSFPTLCVFWRLLLHYLHWPSFLILEVFTVIKTSMVSLNLFDFHYLR